MNIREATADDWPALYPIFVAITAAGHTYAYPQDATSEQARALWMGQGHVVLAEEQGHVVGTATMGANRAGRGAHVATGRFMVDPSAQGRGVGRALGEHLIDWASSNGFRGIQFNAVVETNHAAVHPWHSLGFAIIATVPGAFNHPEHGYVGLHLMYRPLPWPRHQPAPGHEPRPPVPLVDRVPVRWWTPTSQAASLVFAPAAISAMNRARAATVGSVTGRPLPAIAHLHRAQVVQRPLESAERSCSKVRPGTQCTEFSMPQCPRSQSASSAGCAWSWRSDVIA